jgi:hypothetical protein
MKLQAWSHEPQVVEFNYLINKNGDTPTPTHEVLIMRFHEPAKPIGCGCARVVRPDRVIKVWHDPECPEIDRDA